MRVDHRIKLKILDGIDNDLIAGIQIKESDSAHNAPGKKSSFTQRMSIFFNGGQRTSTLNSEGSKTGFLKRGSIFDKRGSSLESNHNNSPAISINNLPNNASRNSYSNVAGNLQIKKENIEEEFEFILNDSFHSVLLYVFKRKFGGNQMVATFEIPMICLAPDDTWHEQVLALKDDTHTDKQGHQFLVFSIQNPIPCFHCNRIMHSDPNFPELEFFKCDGCGILCHEKCHASILSTCSKIVTLKIAYTYEPSKYRPFCDGFFNIETGLLNIYARVCENVDDSSFHILKVLETFSTRKAIDVIVNLCIAEMHAADGHHNVLQYPSLALNLLELYMKTKAGDFLVFALEKSISQIIHEDADCELDSNKLAKAKTAHISEKLGNLENYLEQIFRGITTSPKSCPFSLRCIISKLYENATKVFDGEPIAGYVVSSGILFTNFFIPAILAPDKFGIFTHSQSPNSQRTLINLSKILQKISKLDFFDSNTDINFQKLNRLIGSYHPIVSIYIDELRKVDMSPVAEETVTAAEKVVENIKKPAKKPWLQKLFPFCFPDKALAKSSSDLDIFKRKNEQNLDWENLDIIGEKTPESSERDIHIAGLGRSLLRHGDKLIFACQNEEETKLTYSALEWASALRGNRQQAEDLRRMAIMRIQQEYLLQFYTEDRDDLNEGLDDCTDSSREPTDFIKDDVVQTPHLDLILETNESNDSISSNSLDGKRGISSPGFSYSRKSAYEVKAESNSIQSQSILRGFISSIHSVSSELECQEERGNTNQEITEELETPIIGDVLKAEDHKNTHEEYDQVHETNEEEYVDNIRPDIILQKRKSLASNLDSILRPQNDKIEPVALESLTLPVNTKQADFKKLLPQFSSKPKFKTTSNTIQELAAPEQIIRPTLKRDDTGSFVIQKKIG